VVKVQGNECPRGEAYAKAEIENPLRIFTGTVLAEGMPLKMVPVRTDKPIPKAKIIEAAVQVKKIRVTKPLRIGEVLARDFLGLGVNLVSSRETFLKK